MTAKLAGDILHILIGGFQVKEWVWEHKIFTNKLFIKSVLRFAAWALSFILQVEAPPNLPHLLFKMFLFKGHLHNIKCDSLTILKCTILSIKHI